MKYITFNSFGMITKMAINILHSFDILFFCAAFVDIACNNQPPLWYPTPDGFRVSLLNTNCPISFKILMMIANDDN